MLNNVSLIGRAVVDPEVRMTTNGKKVCSGRIAVDRNYKDKEGNYPTDFFNFVIFGDNRVDTFAKYISKGDMFSINGRLEMRTYQDKEGNNRVTHEINVNAYDFIDTRSRNKPVNNEDMPSTTNNYNNNVSNDDDLPF